jgi:cysteine synthase A
MLGLSSTFWERFRLPSKFTRDLVWGLLLGVTFSLTSTSLALIGQSWRKKRSIAHIPPRPIEIRSEEIVDGVIGLIGGLGAGEGSRRELSQRKYTFDTHQLAQQCARC